MRVLTNPKLDVSLEEFVKRHPGEPIRIRIQPWLYHPAVGRKRHGAYKVWRRASFRIDVGSAEEGSAFREALTAFFYSCQRNGIGPTQHRLLTNG